MSKKDIIEKVAEKLNVTKSEAEEMINNTFMTLASTVQTDKRVAIPGFGIFVLKERKKRDGINPRTGEKIKIPAKKVVTFKLSKSWKEKLNK